MFGVSSRQMLLRSMQLFRYATGWTGRAEILPRPISSIDGLSARESAIVSGLDDRGDRGVNFRSLGVHTEFVKKLSERGITRATPIQNLALPVVFKRQNAVIHSETGSGKTLAFLLPALQDNFQQARSTCTVIVVPTRELASQLLREVKMLSDNQLAVALVSGVDEHEQYEMMLSGSPQIVIGTPKRLVSILDRHSSLFSNVRRIIIDEVDKVVDPLKHHVSQRKQQSRLWHVRPGMEVVQVLQRISRARKLHFVSATATVNSTLLDDLRQMGFEKLSVISSLDRNTVPACISHQYAFSLEDSEHGRINMLYNLFDQSGCKSALVFVHRGASVDRFVSHLHRLGIRAIALWRKAEQPNSSVFHKFLEDFKSGAIELAVANEETVRGLDFNWLTQVYLTEVPRTVGEYLHMCGRVGRQGLEGRATTVISNKQKDFVRQLKFYQKLGVSGGEISLDVKPKVARKTD